MVEAPAKYVKELGFSTDSNGRNVNGITRLLVLKSKKYGSTSAVLMQIHGDAGVNISNVHYMAVPQNFSGNIFYTTLQGFFINGYVYKNGKITLVSVPKTTAKPTGPQILQFDAVGYCVIVTIDWFTNTCYWEQDGSLERCTAWVYDYTEVDTYCVPGQIIGVGGGGGVTPTGDCPPDDGGGNNNYSVSSVNGKLIVQKEAPGDNPCTVPQPCQTGTHNDGSGNYVPDISLRQQFMKSIDTTNLSKCFKNVLASLINNNSNCIADCISAFTGDTPGYKWYMVDGDAGNGNNANTNPAGIPGEISMISTFNSSLYTNGTDLAIARTIIHESMHAYLATYFRNDVIEARKDYPTLVQDYINGQSSVYAQHHQMTDLIGDIATQLQLYGQSQGYNLDYQYYSDLAWGGLETTSQFNNLSSTSKDRILNILNEEQFGTDIHGNYPNTNQQKGKPSTCH